MKKKPQIYAIDFGTSNSLLAAASSDSVFSPIPLDADASDPSIMRTLLFFPDPQVCYYGSKAISEFVANDMEGRFIRSIKKFLPIRSFIGTFVKNRPLHLEDIIASFLRELRQRANQHFGVEVDRVLLGRPARFSPEESEDNLAESRLRLSASRAGFTDINFCPEPLAAAYEFKNQIESEKIVLVADFGGGTSDFTIIRLRKDTPIQEKLDVLSLGGVSIAGDILDGCLMRSRISHHFGTGVKYKVPLGSNILEMPKHLMEAICSPADISLLRERDTLEFFRNVQNWSLGPEDKHKMDNLFCLINEQIGFSVFESIEATKRILSQKDKAQFLFEYFNVNIKENILRKEFAEYTQASVDKIFASLDETVKSANLKYDQIDVVCLTGGTAKVLSIVEGLEARFGREKIREHRHFHSIVQGLSHAAMQLI